MSHYLYIDIETLPSATMPDPATLTPPANYRDPVKIAEWRNEHAAEAWERTALDPLRGQIACIGYAIDDAPVRVLWTAPGMADGVPVPDRLTEALDTIAGELSELRELTKWVGWNIAGFDLRWLKLHAIKRRSRLARLVPYDKWDKRVVDLMHVFAGPTQRDYSRQADVAAFFDCAPTTPPGSHTLRQYVAGDWTAIMDHCAEDVETLRRLADTIDIY